MKLFKTNNINTVRVCQVQFGYRLPRFIYPESYWFVF